MSKKGPVLLIWDRIGDYHMSRVKACERILDVPVFTANLGSGDTLYKWDNIQRENHVNLSSKGVEEKDLLHRFKTFRKLIREKKIKTIAVGYGHTEYLLFLLYARLKGIRTIVFCESWYSRGTLKDYLKALLLKVIGSYYFVSGKRAHLHFVNNYSISSDRISRGYSVVDNEHFKSNRPFAERANELICIARYSEEKNLALLIRAFQHSALSKRYVLKIVGDGPDKGQLTRLITGNSVILKPWQHYSALPEIYANAKIFILPSRFEPWGLVVNEAMAAGLPLLLSEECGCLPDLLNEDRNGSSFRWNDEQQLTALLNLWNTYSDQQLEMMGKYSKEIIAAYTPEQWAWTILSIRASS